MERSEPARAKPSGIARASLVLGLLSVFGACLSFSLFIYVMANEVRIGAAMENISVFLFFGFFLVSIAGVIVGLAGTLRKDTHRIQVIAGAALSLVSAFALGIPVLLWLNEIF